MLFAGIIFVMSALGIVGLFVLKYYEAKHDRVLFPQWREKADEQALRLKDEMYHVGERLEKVPPAAAFWSRVLVHDAAIGFAALARISEAQAHRLADFVSHKHRFERRETQSDFLRKVAEHKNGSAN